MYPHGRQLFSTSPTHMVLDSSCAKSINLKLLYLLYMGFHFKEVEDMDAILSVYFYNNLTIRKISIKSS